MDVQGRKQYPSEILTEDPRRLETQVRVFKRWLNSLLKQANAREVIDILDIFRDTKNLYYLCKHLAGQRLMNYKESVSEDASFLDKAVALVERLYGPEIASVIQTAVLEISVKQAADIESQLRNNTLESNSPLHNLLTFALDAIWIFIVAVRAGTGPPSNLGGSISSSGSTITRRSWTGSSGAQTQSAPFITVRTPCLDRWLLTQDERLMAWCIAVTEGYNGLSICNFTNSWRDGLAFLAIAHQSRPDLFAYETRLEKTVNQNLSLAFHLATAEFATPRLLEPMDMHPDSVDARATAAYIMEFRRAVERDRKRRSRGILEIQTTAMAQDQSELNPEGNALNVTVLSRSSPTSSASASEITWLDEEEFDEEQGEEAGKLSLPDPEMFDTMIETTLAWLLAMEEQFANNDLTKHDNSFQLIDNFQWSDYCKTDVKTKLHTFTHLTTEERAEMELLTKLSAEGLKKLHSKILARVDEAMTHFEMHEDLTAHLSRRQMSVGRCLRLGSRIITVCRDRSQLEQTRLRNEEDEMADLDREDQARIRDRLMKMDPEVIQRQTALLATRWNNLCRVNQTLGRRITTCLLRRQGMLLIAIRLQLEKLEAEQKRQAQLTFGPSIRELKSQLEVNRSLEEGIEIGEILAERLDNFITLVPLRGSEETAEKDSGLESIITELATRWSRLVEWVNTRYAKLQNALLHWRHFEEEASFLSDWLTERAEEVGRVSAMATAAHAKSTNCRTPGERERGSASSLLKSMEPPSPLPRTEVRDIEFDRSTSTGDQFVTNESIQRLLDENAAEMEAVDACLAMHESHWAQMLASLDRRAQALRESCGNTEEVSRLVEATVDQLVSRWSQLAEPQLSTDEWLDRYTKDMDGYLEISRQDLISNSSDAQKELEDPNNKQTPTDKLLVPKMSKMSHLDSPPPASPTGYRAEFELKAEELLNWLENSAEALELITMEKHRAQEVKTQALAVGRKVAGGLDVQIENAVDVTDRISREAVEWRENMNRVLNMGKQYHEELQLAGESVEELDQLFEEVEERWGYLDNLLEEAKRQIRVANQSAEFQQEAAKIQELLTKSQEFDPTQSPVITHAQVIPADTIVSHASPPENYTQDSSEISELNRTTELVNDLLTRLESEVGASVTFCNPDDLDDQVTSAKNFRKELHEKEEKLCILLKRMNTRGAPAEYVTRIESVQTQLANALEKMKNHQHLLQELNDQLEFFMNQFEGIEKWLSDMRDYLDSVSQAHLPSTTVISAQLQESCEALKDMDTLEPTLLKVDEVAEHLSNHCTPEYKKVLHERLDGLRANWAQVRELTKSNRDQLQEWLSDKLATQNSSDADGPRQSSADLRTPQSTSLPDMTTTVGASDVRISQTVGGKNPLDAHTPSGMGTISSVQDSQGLRSSMGNEPPVLRVDLSQLELWMTEAKQRLNEFNVVVSNSNLEQLEQTIQDLSEEIAQRRYILAALDTQVAVGMLDQPISETESLMTKAHFADLESAIAAERERARGARYHLEDFHTVLSGEKRWFGHVSELIARIASSEYEDLSELSDMLESLDRLTNEHCTEDEERLDSLANSLTASKVMANSVNNELKEYKNNLAMIRDEIESTRVKNQKIISQCETLESQADELMSWLEMVKNELSPLIGTDTSDTYDAKKIAEWEKRLGEVDQFILRLEPQFAEAKSQAFSKLLLHKIQLIREQLQERSAAVKQLFLRSAKPTEFDRRLTNVRHVLSSLTGAADALEIQSLAPDHIRKNIEKAKDLLTQLNEVKPDVDYIQQTGPILVENKAVEFPDRLFSDVATMGEQQKKLVMSVLLSHERLEDALPLAEQLNQSVTGLNSKLASVEEVMDYLENADCPQLRRDMLQRGYTTLEGLCEKDGAVEGIRNIVEKLKRIIETPSKALLTAFNEIEERLNWSINTKQAFRAQLEQTDSTRVEVKEQEKNHTVNTAKPTTDHVTPSTKLSVNETIEHLLNPDTPVSTAVRELAADIRDHFRSLALFNRFCLGTNAPLPVPSALSEGREKSHLLADNQYETTIAERKAIVKHFRQQRTHLGDRLRELIVNAGGAETGDRLKDLLRLQAVWHETNDKFDRRGEHMALLEQQLSTAEQAIGDYMISPTEHQRLHCEKLLKNLEQVYGWKLTIDHERIYRRTSGQSSTTLPPTLDEPKKVWSFDQGLEKYEYDLKTVSRNLNEIQAELDICKSGLLKDLKAVVKRLENRFIESYQLLSAAAATLNTLTAERSHSELTAHGEVSENVRKSSDLNAEELIWLKVLLDTQKSRIDIYSSEFKANRDQWFARAQQWDAFCNDLELLNSALRRINLMDNEQRGKTSTELQDQLRLACEQFASLNQIGSTLIQADGEQYGRLESSAPVGRHSALGVQHETPVHLSSISSEPTCPPAVPPRKNSLHRGRLLAFSESERESIQSQLTSIKINLDELCRRHACPTLQGESSELDTHIQSLSNNNFSTTEAEATKGHKQQSYVNVDWSDGGTPQLPPSLSQSALESCGNCRKDVEICLQGLSGENLWFTEESGLVPTGLDKRKSDDILLSSTANRAKPTTPAEQRLDSRFWLGSSSFSENKQSSGPIEYTPSWLKSKWAELESLIEITFEHEKQSNNWCRKAAQLVKVLRERASQQRSNGTPDLSRVISRLESGSSNLREALNHAQQALKRRKACLMRWQSNLVELDTIVADINSIMRSFEMSGVEICEETPSIWLRKLNDYLLDKRKNGAEPISLEQWLTELNPRNTGLGGHLEKLRITWNFIQEGKKFSEPANIVCVPTHLAVQVKNLTEEWEKMKTVFNLKSTDDWPLEVKRETENNVSAIKATVICAPSAWPVHSASGTVVVSPSPGMRGSVVSGGSVLNQTTSPTLARIRHEIDQLSRWLTSVHHFIEVSRVRLGDRFDQETVNRQLQQAKLATSEGSQTSLQQLYHPAALQLKIQQFLTELEARKPHLDRIKIERDRLTAWDSEEVLNGIFASQAENLPNLWDVAEQQMHQRASELEVVISETQRLKDLEREIDRWMHKAQAELDSIDLARDANGTGTTASTKYSYSRLDADKRKRLQDLSDDLYGPVKENWERYQRDCESLIKRFNMEDTSKLQSDLDNFTIRWKELHERLVQAKQWMMTNRSEARSKSPDPDADRIVLVKQRATPSAECYPSEVMVERLEQMERRLGLLDLDLRQGTGLSENAAWAERRNQIIAELQAMHNELNTLSIQMRPNNTDAASVPDNELLQRLRQIRERVVALRQSVQTPTSQHSIFLARLKQLNSWVSHRDAAFRAIICPLHGDLLFIMKMRELMLNLFHELETQRVQVEDVLQQGQLHYGEEKADANWESEVESDGSEFGLHGLSTSREDAELSSVKQTPGEEQTKRMLRRIRRYLYHLKKRWTTLNTSMIDYKQQLDSISERLTNFQSLFNDAVEQVKSAHTVTLRWIPVENIQLDHLNAELDQVQSFYEACEPLIVLLNNLDRQLVQFRDSAITIDPGVITQQAALRNDFHQVRLITENRIQAITQTLASIQVHPQQNLTFARISSHRQTPSTTARTPIQDGMQASITLSPPMVDPLVPLSDSVSPPWERCVHPSGTQVPYYKNHATQETQWDHPILAELMQSMKQLNGIRFAEYRTALKLRRLQKTLCLDALSISIIAESLKLIGHSQPIEGPHTDPFDRTINVPQIVDCLLQLYNRANSSYGHPTDEGRTQHKAAGINEFDPQSGLDDPLNPGYSPRKTPPNPRCSTLPSGTKATDISDADASRGRGSITKCGRAFRRSQSAQRVSRRRTPTDAGLHQNTTRITPVDFTLKETNRSASLPESVQLAATRSSHSSIRRNQTNKLRKGYPTGPTKYPVNVCVDLTLNWLLNVYDRMRKGNIRALSLKVALTVLSIANLDDKYRYLFSLIADSNGYVTEQRLSALLYECILIPRNLGEGGWIGKEDFTTTVKLCFSQVLEIARGSDRHQNSSPYRGQNIPVRHFLTWLRFGPQTIIWLPLLHRVMLAEFMIHPVRCGVCQAHPIVGLRYRCLRCLNFDLCQQCFFSGRTARSHKLTHPMQEYCSNSTSSDSFRDFTRIVRNRFRSRERLQQANKPQSVLGHPTIQPTGLHRGRARCCEPAEFSEDKPRLAPKFGPDLASLIPRDATMEPSNKREEFKGNSMESTEPTFMHSQTPNTVEPIISRPMSTQLTSALEHRLPPRAASDTQQVTLPYRDVNSVTATQRGDEQLTTPIHTGRGSIPIADDEHHLIARYSRELRQQSEPELTPGKNAPPENMSTIPGFMDRSTISDGLPNFPIPLVGESHTGHLSLDRRQLGRTTGSQPVPYTGYSTGHLDPHIVYGRFGGVDPITGFQMGTQSSYPPVQQLKNYPVVSNSSLPRDHSYDLQNPQLQRSYSLRARSQPPPDAQWQLSHKQHNATTDIRSQFYPSNVSNQTAYTQSTIQNIRSLEEERRVLLSEYDKLRQRGFPPAVPYTNASRIQTQQAQQRFARMQLQHQMLQQQDPWVNPTRGYSQRIPLQRPPSAGQVYSNVASISGRVAYGGSLGRANSITNGSILLGDTYGSEPRVGVPYSSENLTLTNADLQTTPMATSGDIAATEARLLREHKGRLEVRMQQLEDHNRQLEQQLQRLRQYLVSGVSSTPSGTLKLPGESKASTELLLDSKSVRQRSASGGLAGQYDDNDGKQLVGGGSVGQLTNVTRDGHESNRSQKPSLCGLSPTEVNRYN